MITNESDIMSNNDSSAMFEKPTWAADILDERTTPSGGECVSWTSGPLASTDDFEAIIERVDCLGLRGEPITGDPVLSVTFGVNDIVDFCTVAEARSAGRALIDAAAKFEEALCADAGRRVMDVEYANSRDGERVYLVTQTETATGYSRVCQMRYPNPPHREAALLKKGQSWTTDEYRYTLHGLFDRIEKLDDTLTRYIEVN